jgi:hypothetical protein
MNGRHRKKGQKNGATEQKIFSSKTKSLKRGKKKAKKAEKKKEKKKRER